MDSNQLRSTSTATVPRLIQLKGSVHDDTGKPLSGNLGITFALYKDANDQVAVWQENQNVRLDSAGHYSVLLGATNEGGLPLEIFSAGEARWLGVRPGGQAEQPRILFLSVAYALKAADTEMLGGRPASAYVLADSLSSSAQLRPRECAARAADSHPPDFRLVEPRHRKHPVPLSPAMEPPPRTRSPSSPAPATLRIRPSSNRAAMSGSALPVPPGCWTLRERLSSEIH